MSNNKTSEERYDNTTMEEYDDIISKFMPSSEQPQQQKLAEARQRIEDKLRKRLENSPYAPYVPPPQSQQPTPSEWDKYRGIGYGEYDHNPFNVYDQVPEPIINPNMVVVVIVTIGVVHLSLYWFYKLIMAFINNKLPFIDFEK